MKFGMLLSGGVDSSVAMALLKQEGHDIQAYYLKIWLEDELSYLGNCPWEEDLQYAQATCKALGIPLKVVSLQREYHERVVEYTIQELRKGFTPSPDIFCNERIKFGVFLERMGEEWDRVASGHYAEIVRDEDICRLKEAPDPVKDQTYFLAHLHQNQLQRLYFPLKGRKKKEVRHLAHEFNLPTKDRKDSQGICFLGKIKYADFVKHHLGVKKGKIVEWETGKVWGEHEGYWFYTIGQRKGIGLHGGPWYVVKKDVQENIVYISHQKYLDQRKSRTFQVGEFNWIEEIPQNKSLELDVKVRHGPRKYKARLSFLEEGSKGEVELLDDGDPGVAPGQFAVFYENGFCLGCAKILEKYVWGT